MSDVWRHILHHDGRPISITEPEVIVGRSRGCDVSIVEASISRRHVRIVAAGEALIVEDLGSSNGTFINDEPISGRTTVRHGDTLGLGDAEMKVEIVRETPVPSPPLAGGGHGDATMFLSAQSSALAESIEKKMPGNEQIYGTIAIPMQPADPGLDQPPEVGLDSGLDLELVPEEAAIEPPTPESPAPDLPALGPTTPGPTATESPSASTDIVEASTEADAKSKNWLDSAAFADIETPPLPVAPLEVTAPAPKAIPKLPPADWLPRLAAWGIDLAALAAGSALLWIALGLNEQAGGWRTALIAGGAIGLVAMIAGWGLWGATPGKRAFKLYVCTQDGQPGIGLGRAGLRTAGWLLSVLTLGIGFAFALGSSGHALHDRIAGTYVGTTT